MKRIINKIRLLFSSLNVIGNINELIVKMHELEERIDNNYDKLEDKIEEEGKLIDDLERDVNNINLTRKVGK